MAKKSNKKTLVRIEKLGNGQFVIVEQTFQWADFFNTEEEATTYALREGCKVVGTLGDVVE